MLINKTENAFQENNERTIQPFLSTSIMLKIQEKCDEKIDKIISDKTENIFKSFI